MSYRRPTLTPAEAAHALGYKTRKPILRLFQDGVLSGFRVPNKRLGGGDLMIFADSLEKLKTDDEEKKALALARRHGL